MKLLGPDNQPMTLADVERLPVGHTLAALVYLVHGLLAPVASGAIDIGERSWKSTMYCAWARSWIDDSGITGCTILIVSVSPDAENLRRYVAGELEKIGWPGVEVVTEW